MGPKAAAGTQGARVGGERTVNQMCALARRRGRSRKIGRLHARFLEKMTQDGDREAIGDPRRESLTAKVDVRHRESTLKDVE